jgi:hypothetical protein
LEAFIEKVTDDITEEKIDPALGNFYIMMASDIISLLLGG